MPLIRSSRHFALRRLPTGTGRLLAALSLGALLAGSILLAPSVALARPTPVSNQYAVTFLDVSALGPNSTAVAYDLSGNTTVGASVALTQHALRWDGATVTDLHATGNIDSLLGGTSVSAAEGFAGNVAVGYAQKQFSGIYHAIRWDGTIATDLTPYSLFGSDASGAALDISGNRAVGYGGGSNSNYHALTWDGTTVNDLHVSSGVDSLLGAGSASEAEAISGNSIVGDGAGSSTGDISHALRWDGDTLTDLHTAGNVNALLGSDAESLVMGLDGTTSVGMGDGELTNYHYHALRWDGTALTDLHTAGNVDAILGDQSRSVANAAAGDVTVGTGTTDNNSRNRALLWNGTTALDLNTFVVGPANAQSFAFAIDPITGVIAGRWRTNATLWIPLNAGMGSANHLAVQSGTLTSIRTDFTQSAGAAVVNGTLVLSDGTNARTFTLTGGTLGGTGTITGNLVVAGGTLAPGNSPGTLTLTGNFAQSSGTFAVEIASLSTFDVLNVSGTATFTGGDLAISLLGGYVPNAGDSFTILTTGGGITCLDTIVTPTGWTFTQSGNNGVLTFVGGIVVPETGTGLLALAGLLPFTALLRRRK